jgi:putative addiction module component (TIGR02574 family)
MSAAERASGADLSSGERVMPTMMESFGLDRLSTAERIILVEELWDSIAASSEPFALSEAHREDLQRRLDAHRDDPKAGAPWAEVKARSQSVPVRDRVMAR